eukprot:3411659-Amphidinium_carterae.1
MQATASGGNEEDVLLTDLPDAPQFDVPLSALGGFEGCRACEFSSFLSRAVIDQEADWCCLECNEEFDYRAASALRGQCMCGG